MPRYWLGLGANIGDRRATVEAAIAWLERVVRVEAVSAAFETAPREVLDQPPFLNAAARIATPLAPPDLLSEAKRLERELGRDPGGVRFGPRAIDCDVLLWEGGVWRDARSRGAAPTAGRASLRAAAAARPRPRPEAAGRPRLADLEAALDPLEQPARRLDAPLARPRIAESREL